MCSPSALTSIGLNLLREIRRKEHNNVAISRDFLALPDPDEYKDFYT
jgi:hypothetical protein